ncbi:hypothetical protein G6F26_013584 [Rhizopus arrhizus]|nr:hypothetical protein G6F34_014035 [Rhizopus arrhizus]KAG0893333.1 hypothetical protein G6F33_013875 [Rhizopus arrhizus]KAG0923709.1 hypothetical protein G6F30_013812 [Rhizopus arrhizus]KAG1010359.1 hypothetical protein G6F26_013584 [Rhizopus arrhizus]KAG1367072.1 hypothetical protein G6F61_013214 [Rhizopus arrhizus]
MKRRLAWAKKYQNWTTDDWRRVVFSDETKVNVWGSDGCKYYWSRPEDPLKPHHIDVTVKHGGGSLMMWGCMTHEGPGKVKLSQACAFEQFFQLNAFYNDNIIDLSDVTNVVEQRLIITDIE